MSNQNNKVEKNGNNLPDKRQPTHSERFQAAVTKEFSALVGKPIELDDHQQRLVQNLFVKTDIALNDFEANRIAKNKGGQPIIWANIDMAKLAVDGVHRVRLGLDALIPNHIHPIPYWNSKNSKYDLDLQIGYEGKDYYRRKVALKHPTDIRYELVYDTDHFKVLKKNVDREVESYEFEVKNPFNRGELIGGFGYITYHDPAFNEVVVVNEQHFKKISGKAKSNAFWGEWGEEMRKKTLVIKTTDHLKIDPEKANSSVHYVESQDSLFIDDLEQKPSQLTEGRKPIDTSKPQSYSDIDSEEVKDGSIVSDDELAKGTVFEGA